MEFRTIRPDEADEFLRLMCSVFSLDFERARGVFRSEPFFDVKSKWAAVQNGEILACLTTVPLHFGIGGAIGIAGVGTREDFRGQGLASDLLQTAVAACQEQSEGRALLFARDERIYARLGFEVLDDVVVAPMGDPEIEVVCPPASFNFVRAVYDRWAAEHPLRLRRDERRWNYWTWSSKQPIKVGDGYYAMESPRIRELLPSYVGSATRDPQEFFGLRSMVQALGLVPPRATGDLVLMGKGFSEVPRMFMTDQF